MRSPLLITILLLVFFANPLLAQDTFEEWQKERTQEFKEFKDERDKEFMKMLNSAWKAINSNNAGETYQEPKPEKIPKADKPNVELDRPADEPIIEQITIPKGDHDPGTPQKIDMPEASEQIEGYESSGIDFFEVSVPFSFPKSMKGALETKIDEDAISNFWGKLGKSNYTPMLDQTQSLKEELSLNDWGYALLLYRLGQDVYGEASNESVLYTWFMLTKSGYQAKVGYDQEGVYLLVPTANQLFNTKFFRIDGLKHYALMLDNTESVPSSIFTYDGSYPEANKKMDLNIKNTPKFKKSLIKKSFSFEYDGQTYKVPVQIDRNMIAFYKLYPLTELDVYIEATMSSETRASLLGSLGEIIKGKSETQAANILLRFVQTAFEYKTDQQQFGYEKYLLPEETLFYQYSDCDDRTIMFARLVQELLGLDVVGIRYPGHLAAAVNFSKPPQGDYIKADGERYTVTDPTYENATVGMTMPQYKNKKPEILRLE